MKKIRSLRQAASTGAVVLLLAALPVPGAAEAGPVDAPETGPWGAAPEVIEMVVPGLSCPFCAYGLEKRLRSEIEDLSDLEIEAATGKVSFRVVDGSGLTDEDLRAIVRKAGFSVKELARKPDAGGAHDAPTPREATETRGAEQELR